MNEYDVPAAYLQISCLQISSRRSILVNCNPHSIARVQYTLGSQCGRLACGVRIACYQCVSTEITQHQGCEIN